MKSSDNSGPHLDVIPTTIVPVVVHDAVPPVIIGPKLDAIPSTLTFITEPDKNQGGTTGTHIASVNSFSEMKSHFEASASVLPSSVTASIAPNDVRPTGGILADLFMHHNMLLASWNW